MNEHTGPADRGPRQTAARLEAVLDELAGADPGVSVRAEELVRLLAEMYGAGLERVVELLRASPDGSAAVERLGADPFVGNLLALHDLHPVALHTRVSDALDGVRPYLGSHAGGVELLGIGDDGVVRLRLEGSCDGCASSTMTVKLAIETAIEDVAPEVTAVEVEGMVAEPAPTLLQIQPSPYRADDSRGQTTGGGTWQPLPDSAALVPGQLSRRDVAGLELLLCRLDEGLYAYRDRCPACGGTVTSGRLEGPVLSCPTCAARFDVHRAGRGVDDDRLHLEPVPLLVDEDGGAQVAVGYAMAAPESAGSSPR